MKTSKPRPQDKPRGKNLPMPAIPPHVESLMTRADVCASLRVGLRTFQRMVAAGEYPAGKPLGGVPRWHKAAHDEWVRRFWEGEREG